MARIYAIRASLAVAVMAAAAGCAPGYHAYPCGAVPYTYCPEPPLPFTHYCGYPTSCEIHQDLPEAPPADAADQPLDPPPPLIPQ